MPVNQNTPLPWYRQFWPWFIIALPASVVVAGISMVFVAFHHADTLVNDDYYRDGLAINERLAEDQEALRLGLRAEVVFDTLTGEVTVELAGAEDPVKSLKLLLIHPVDENRDQSIDLAYLGEGRYRADLESVPANRYYLRLQAPPGQGWRLNGELDFTSARQVTLIPNI